MNAQQLIKYDILCLLAKYNDSIDVTEMTPEIINFLFEDDEIIEGIYENGLIDEVRNSGIETNIPAGYSRHYESKSVAKQIRGQWVGWTYWYGGGKYSNTESIDWIENVYLLNCTEKEEVVITRNFEKVVDKD